MLKSFLAAALVFAATLTREANAYAPCEPGQSEIAVEYASGIFCVKGSKICAAETSEGACPGIQDGLPFGSYCGRVASGVFGCKTLDADSIKTFQPWVDPASTGGNPPCAADVDNGACPGVQNGLPFGSYCGRVASGVFGCKVGTSSGGAPAPSAATATATTTTAAPAPSAMPTMNPAPVTATATTSNATPTTTTTTSSTLTPSSGDCPNGGSPMSVEGVTKVFCVTGIACAADIATGNCPGEQAGLPFGSFCDEVHTGVYGCRAYVAKTKKPEFAYPAPLKCTGNPAGSTPVSIVGAVQSFCASEPVCSGSRYGNCPGIQSGLDKASTCAIIATGVHGCVFK